MLSTWVWIVFNLLICTGASPADDNIKAFIEYTELEYEDACSSTAEAEWSFVNSPSNKTLAAWEAKLIELANFKKVQKSEVRNISKENLKDTSLQYKYDVIETPGDALLNSSDFETFVQFIGSTELRAATRIVQEKSKNYTRKETEHVLSHHNNDAETLRRIWFTWNQELSPFVRNFSDNLWLLANATKANDARDVAEYWELLSGYTDGYDKMKNEWNKIVGLHRKVFNFGLAALSHKYSVTMNETMPAYLLGSLQGHEWVNTAADITPYPNVVFDIKRNLWKKKLIGKMLYRTASSMGSIMLNQVPQAEFWDKSYFNKECPATVINFCKDGITRVSTCFEPTISNFLTAHKNVAKVAVNQMSDKDSPVLNTANRYSALEEGVSELFGILSVSPAWLNHSDLMDNSTDNERKITSLMITALDVLPRLAYYLSADTWRIEAIENDVKEPADLISSWWKNRREYEGTSPNGTELPTFLNDDHIIKNKPYLSKFIGILLGFQLYDHLMDSTQVRYDRLLAKPISPKFIEMIRQGSADSWASVLEKYLEIDDISADSLLSFFSPLEDFLDELDEDYQYKSLNSREVELEELERKIIEDMNAPPTTTTTTASPVTTMYTKRRMTYTTQASKEKATRSDLNSMSPTDKRLESKSSVQKEDKPDNTEKSEASTKVPLDQSLIDNETEEQEEKPKINTSKAVWAVGAVLLATIVVCVIAIFGRQRCRKTPKNRRYV